MKTYISVFLKEPKIPEFLLQKSILRVFEFYPAMIYRGHVIMRADLPHIKNNVRPWKIFPNGEISNSWTRKE